MAAHRHDAAAGTAHVAKQKLHDPCRANHLHAGRMLCPPDGVHDRARALAARVVTKRFGNTQKILCTTTADRSNHFGRVARVVTPQDVQHATRILQRAIGGWLWVSNETETLAKR